jgi:hypothetical protein
VTASPAGIPTGRATWLDPAWRGEIIEWADAELAARGRRIVGDVEQPHVRPWSTALRIPTDDGVAWCKASGPGSAHEGPLLEVVRRHGAPHVLLPLAVHPERPWLLFDDGGPTLRATRPDGTGDHDLEAWDRILREYAALQRSLEDEATTAEMLVAGVPDGRPVRLTRQLARLLDDDVAWARLTGEEAESGPSARARLRAAMPAIESAARELAGLSVADTLQHDDFHGGNILVGPDGDRFFDWGDGIVAHPFGTLTATFNSIAHHTGRSHDDPVFEALRDAYLEAWIDAAPRADLLRAVALARDFGCIGRSLAWERSLLDLEVEEMDGFGDSIAGWLVEFAGRLDGPAWADAPGLR